VWRAMPIPPGVRSFGDLETFVPQAAAAAGLNPDQPLPFLIRGRADLIDFHVLNRIGNDPHNAEIHKKIQIAFELTQPDAMIVGFYSKLHRGFSSRWIPRSTCTSRRPTTNSPVIFRPLRSVAMRC
jgi:hypothetical protein